MAVLLILLLLPILLPSINAQPQCITSGGNYTTNNSTYRASLDTVLSSLSTNINATGFYSTSAGQTSDRANAVALCRGDLTLDECRTCVRTAAAELSIACENRNQAVTWTEQCLIRYSNQPIFGTAALTEPKSWWWNLNNATNPDQYESDLRSLLDTLRDEAASGGSLRKVAGRNVTSTDFQGIFALVQCTPDLSPVDCSNCLRTAEQDIPGCCDRKIGGRVLQPSCTLRFESYAFFNQTRLDELSAPVAPPPSVLPVARTNTSNRTRNIIIVAVSSVVGCLIVAVIVGIVFFTKSRKHNLPSMSEKDEISTIESLHYDFGTIRGATNEFSDDNRLGQGGFGTVYKGKLPDGRKIAVKRLSKDSGQGIVEFKNEVLLLARLQHRNLVRLLGFAIEGIEKLLVYEFLPNGSLDLFLFDPSKHPTLGWDIRYKIIRGIAKGLLYLHEDSRLKIIHRDLKASNVLLDEEMNAKIADFGMAKLCGHDETQGTTSKIVGTYGYMSPEYAMHGHFSIKSDVFSFGVILLEIISGQRNNNFQSEDTTADLLSFAWKNWHNGTFINIVDPLLRSGIGSITDIQRCIHIGLLCVQENADDRPTMASVVLMLNSFSITLAVPSEPAFYLHSRGDSQFAYMIDTKSHKSDEHKSENECSISELYPR